MRSYFLAPLVVIFATQFAAAAPPKPPAVVTLRVGEITSVEIAGEPGKEIAWAPGFAAEACYLDEGKPYRKDTARLIVSPKAAGVFRVVLWTVGEREYSTLIIDASGDTPIPPPKPKPPPDVPPPVPVDEYTKALKAAYDADPAPDKRERAKSLAAAMRSAAKFADDATLTTNNALAAKVSAETKTLVGDSLKPVRGEIGKYLAARFPADVVTLTPELRTRFREAYTKTADVIATLPETP